MAWKACGLDDPGIPFLASLERVQQPEKRPRGFKRSDSRVRRNISELLSEHPAIDSSNIVVSVLEGEVILSGSVEEREQKILAELVAIDVYGVRDVANRIGVGLAAETYFERDRG